MAEEPTSRQSKEEISEELIEKPKERVDQVRDWFMSSGHGTISLSPGRIGKTSSILFTVTQPFGTPFFKEPLSPDTLDTEAQAYAEDMMQQLDMFNDENPLPVGELVTTAPDRGQLMDQFKQFFYHYVAEQRGVVPE